MRTTWPFLLSVVVSGLCPAQGPTIAADGRVTFRLQAPQASAIAVTGEFVSGPQKLEKDGAGLWSITLGPLQPEIYSYTFTIDGVRTIDPGNPRIRTGATSAGLASLLEVAAAQPTIYDAQPVPHGEIHTHWYESKSIGELRRVTVYTPPEYERRPSVRYPVLYLFHGANQDEMSWASVGRVNHILDNLLAAGKTKPFLVVMPYGYGVKPWATVPKPADHENNTNLVGRDLVDDIIPFVESHYRVNADRGSRAIAGLSMGGAQAVSIGVARLDLFSYVAGFSPSLRLPNAEPPLLEKTLKRLISNPEDANRKLNLFWIGSGTDEPMHNALSDMAEFLKQHRINHQFWTTAGAHTWITWRRHLAALAPLLFRMER